MKTRGRVSQERCSIEGRKEKSEGRERERTLRVRSHFSPIRAVDSRWAIEEEEHVRRKEDDKVDAFFDVGVAPWLLSLLLLSLSLFLLFFLSPLSSLLSPVQLDRSRVRGRQPRESPCRLRDPSSSRLRSILLSSESFFSPVVAVAVEKVEEEEEEKAAEAEEEEEDESRARNLLGECSRSGASIFIERVFSRRRTEVLLRYLHGNQSHVRNRWLLFCQYEPGQ